MNYINVNIEENKKIINDELYAVTKERAYEASLCPEEYISIALEVDGEIVARLVGLIFFKVLHIELFSTNEKHRGEGYGTQVLNHVEELAKSKGCHSVYLETLSFFAPRFYRNQDYKILKEIKNSPINGESHFFMFKTFK